MSAISHDRLLGGRVKLAQPQEGYRVAIDPVFLAAAVNPPQGARVLDLGCGVGAAALCLLARRPDLQLVGLEVQPALAELARRNAKDNGVLERFDVVMGDAAQPPALAPFDWVMSNPPFMAAGSAKASEKAGKATADMESSLDLEGWVKAALALLKPKGRLTLIHQAERLPALFSALDRRFGALRLFPLWPRPGSPAKRVLVEATKASRAPALLLPGLVLHSEGQRYSAAAEAVLSLGEALDLSGAGMA